MPCLRSCVGKPLCSRWGTFQSWGPGMPYFTQECGSMCTTYIKTSQAYINYGPLPNSRFLRLYGFILPNNPNDNYELVLSTHPSAPFWEEKRKLWVEAELDSVCTVPLTLSDPIPNRVLRYLRIQRLDREHLESIQPEATADTISGSNEIEILQFLIESFTALLQNFGTKLEVLEAQLAADVYSPGGNAWAAAHVSAGEQRVLRSARNRAVNLLAATQSESGDTPASTPMARCANCGEASGPSMLCGRCRAVSYCSRACQVAHYKQHKGACRAVKIS